ncbi:MAG: hypothetical protein HYZ48_00525 [Chlamydiales bacterium]|nr:hypothetical protein [Chlamydiales bacterium]
MLKNAALCTSFFFLALAILWIAFFAVARKEDYTAYETYRKMKEDTSLKDLAQTAHQNRQGVVKEIYFAQEGSSRLQYRIESNASVLTLKPEGSKFNLIENLEKMRCWMQDKIETPSSDTPSQHIRYLEAEEGIYRYTTQQFQAKTVVLSLYHIQGKELPQNFHPYTPFLNGLAEDISFAISGKTPKFEAHNFKALLNEKSEKKP